MFHTSHTPAMMDDAPQRTGERNRAAHVSHISHASYDGDSPEKKGPMMMNIVETWTGHYQYGRAGGDSNPEDPKLTTV
jgi:hypothetical protein